MTRDDPAAVLSALLQRVPVHAIDLNAARRGGDHAALAYHAAMTAWRAEASEAISEIRRSSFAHGTSDPFTRIAAASELMRQERPDAP